MPVEKLIEELRRMPKNAFMALEIVIIDQGSERYFIDDPDMVSVKYDARNDEAVIRLITTA